MHLRSWQTPSHICLLNSFECIVGTRAPMERRFKGETGQVDGDDRTDSTSSLALEEECQGHFYPGNAAQRRTFGGRISFPGNPRVLVFIAILVIHIF